MTPNSGKYWWQSKTIVTNAVIAVLTGLLAFLEVLYDAGPQLTWGTIIGGLIAMLNVWLRLTTSAPIITGPVQQVGGTQFTGSTQIGAVAGDDVGNVTQASGGAGPFPPPGSDSGVGTV